MPNVPYISTQQLLLFCNVYKVHEIFNAKMTTASFIYPYGPVPHGTIANYFKHLIKSNISDIVFEKPSSNHNYE
jgi:hypothetical protein